MNENIDLTKILKDCPKGWKFYSSIHGDVTFQKIENDSEYPINFFFVNKDNIEAFSSVTEQGFHVHYYNGECTFFPSKDQRDWSKFTAPWYKKVKFDPKTLKPFDKVLTIMANEEWSTHLFSHIRKFQSTNPYVCNGIGYKCCIPYNDDTKHLVGTKEEAPEYYRYWDD